METATYHVCGPAVAKASSSASGTSAIISIRGVSMTFFQVEPAGDTGICTLAGALTARRADELRTALRRAFDVFSHVSMNMESVTEMDRTCLRLLCLTHHKAKLLNKYFTINSVRPNLVEHAVKSGSPGICSDCAEGFENCPWRHYFERTVS